MTMVSFQGAESYKLSRQGATLARTAAACWHVGVDLAGPQRGIWAHHAGPGDNALHGVAVQCNWLAMVPMRQRSA
jgi:hypothetical protein